MAIIPDSVLQGPSDDSLAANEATEIDEIRLARKYKKDDLKRKQRFKMHAHIASVLPSNIYVEGILPLALLDEAWT